MGTEREGPPRPGSRLRDWAFALVAGTIMGLYGLVAAPLALVSATGCRRVMRVYVGTLLGLLRHGLGVETQVRGRVPDYPCVIAAKHQSQLDVYLFFRALTRPRFLMKASLARVPVFGYYTRRIGCITVERGQPGAAAAAVEGFRRAGGEIGQIVVYPQGTRVAPGLAAPWKRGAVLVAESLELPVVPAATNAGVFWDRHGRLKGPGTAVIEFLEPLPAGLDIDAAMGEIERRIERASDALVAEAGGVPAGSG
ncbi:MAG: lysophospholipid acyltransferase family protein [Paracoccaceae bacterium]